MSLSFKPLILTCSLFLSTACTGLPAAAPAPSNPPKPTASPASAAPAPLPTPTPQVIPSAQSSNAPLRTRALTLTLHADKLSAEHQALLQNREINVTLRSQALDGPPPQPAYDLDQESQFPSAPSPSPIFEKEVKLRLNQPFTLENVPEGLELSVYANQLIQAGSDPCSSSATYAVASTALTLSAETPQPLVLALEAQTASDLSACETTVIQGQVFDTDKQPVPGARIAVRSRNESLTLNLETTTDAEGKYLLPGIYAGVQLEITASKAGYATQQRQEIALSNKVGDPAVNHFDFGGSGHPETALQADAS
ncbi:MAG: carboxypeptidase-like regulatory domain-containing protein [Candidatus Sericytochromatia bacterium]